MHPDQNTTRTSTPAATRRRRQFIEYLQQQESLFQQRQQQTSDLSLLLPQSNPTESTSWNPSLNLSSGKPVQTPTTISPVDSGTYPHDWSSAQQNQYEEDELLGEFKDELGAASGSTINVFLEDMPTTSDFVKKLYKMLEEPRFHPIVCWGPRGDCFIVKDMQECTKSVLPRLFKHSNFSSFVRQLNKYGFHKVKSSAVGQQGEHNWIFQHPDFRSGHPEALEKIKRAPSAPSKSASTMASPTNAFPGSSLSPSIANNITHRRRISAPQAHITRNVRPTQTISQDLEDRLATLERNQEGILDELTDFQKGLAARNDFIQSLFALSLQSDLGVNAVPDACASVFDPSSNTDFQEYPSTLAPSDLGLETEQALFANTIQDPELSSLPSNNNTFRMIQPSYDLGSLSSFFGQQTPSPAISTGNRSYRRYSANDGKASSGFSSGLAQYTSSFSDNPEVGNYPSSR